MGVLAILKTYLNIKGLISFMLRHWKECLIVGLLCIVTYQNGSSTRFIFGMQTIPALESELEYTRTELYKCGDANKLLSDSIEKQNSIIEEWRSFSNSLQQYIDKVNNEINKMKKRHDKEINDILSDKAPESCEESIEYLRDGIKDLSWDE